MKSDRWTGERLIDALALYGVTDRMWLPRPFAADDQLGAAALVSDIEACIAGGVTMIQLREKDVTHEQFLQLGRKVAAVCRKHAVPFIIDDDVDAAVELAADGVHVGQSDLPASVVREKIGPDMILGVSVQTPDQAVQAQAAGADYLGTGAVFPTSTKQDAACVSRAQLQSVCEAVTIPVVAIGGISAQNVRQLEGTGIAGISVVSALFAAADKTAAARDLSAVCRTFTQSCTVAARAAEASCKRRSVIKQMKTAVFDMDGTLVDSMQMWMHAGELYLKTKHIEPRPGLWNATRTMDMTHVAGYFQTQYGITSRVATIIEEINDVIYKQYAHAVPLKAGAGELLAFLSDRGIPLILATSTDRRCVDVCLERLGIAPYFSNVLTCSELGAGKDRPDIYIEAARLGGANVTETVVFEDALYAGRTAVRAGFPVCAVYDESALGAGGWHELKALADCSCLSLKELSV